MSTVHSPLSTEYAGVVELVDSLDLGSNARACRFESCRPHHMTQHPTGCWVLFVGRGHIDYGVIAAGNQKILIRCAEHHPADALMGLGFWFDVYIQKFVIPSGTKVESRDLRIEARFAHELVRRSFDSLRSLRMTASGCFATSLVRRI